MALKTKKNRKWMNFSSSQYFRFNILYVSFKCKSRAFDNFVMHISRLLFNISNFHPIIILGWIKLQKMYMGRLAFAKNFRIFRRFMNVTLCHNAGIISSSYYTLATWLAWSIIKGLYRPQSRDPRALWWTFILSRCSPLAMFFLLPSQRLIGIVNLTCYSLVSLRLHRPLSPCWLSWMVCRSFS